MVGVRRSEEVSIDKVEVVSVVLVKEERRDGVEEVRRMGPMGRRMGWDCWRRWDCSRRALMLPMRANSEAL